MCLTTHSRTNSDSSFSYVDNGQPHLSRDQTIKQLTNTSFDVLIIGGGATGAGIALEAISRGLTVGLIQSRDFSSGTSSKYPTCLLLQGGIGFRENGYQKRSVTQFQLDKSAAEERTKYLQISTYLTESYSVFSLIEDKISLLYYIFSSLFVRNISFTLSATKKFPNTLGAVRYRDNLQQDSRLNLMLIATAVERGAICCNYFRSVNLIENGKGKICGVVALNQITGEKLTIRGDVVINATGSGCDLIKHIIPDTIPLKKDKPALGQPKIGVHLVLDQPTLAPGEAYIKPQMDGSVIFFIYFNGYTLAGIEDSHLKLSDPLTATNLEYILSELNRHIEYPVSRDNVNSVWSAWRPIMKDYSSIREFIIDGSVPGLLSVTGGAWSEFRKMGEAVVDMLTVDKVAFPYSILGSDSYKISSLIDQKSLRSFISSKKLLQRSEQRLQRMYGNRFWLIIQLAKENAILLYPLLSSLDYIAAEIVYAVRYEFAIKISDCLLRRFPIGLANPKEAIQMIRSISKIMSKELHWNIGQQQREENEAITEIACLLLPTIK